MYTQAHREGGGGGGTGDTLRMNAFPSSALSVALCIHVGFYDYIAQLMVDLQCRSLRSSTDGRPAVQIIT